VSALSPPLLSCFPKCLWDNYTSKIPQIFLMEIFNSLWKLVGKMQIHKDCILQAASGKILIMLKDTFGKMVGIL